MATKSLLWCKQAMLKFEEVYISFQHPTLSAPEVATITRYQPSYQILRGGSFCVSNFTFSPPTPHEFSSFSRVQTPTSLSRDGQSFQAFSKVTGCYKMKQQISPTPPAPSPSGVKLFDRRSSGNLGKLFKFSHRSERGLHRCAIQLADCVFCKANEMSAANFK